MRVVYQIGSRSGGLGFWEPLTAGIDLSGTRTSTVLPLALALVTRAVERVVTDLETACVLPVWGVAAYARLAAITTVMTATLTLAIIPANEVTPYVVDLRIISYLL